MPDKPAAELEIDEPLVRLLVDAQAGAIQGSTLPLEYVEDGWDCSVWRLGARYSVRLPRRAMAAALVDGEHRHLPAIADRLSDSGVGVPAPVLRGAPAQRYPWPWSVVPWFDGLSGMRVPRAERDGWATRLAEALLALHAPSGGDHPINPYRGVPFAGRADVIARRFAALRAARTSDGWRIDRLERMWDDALHSAPWSGRPVWIHGDLHPGNLIARGGELVAIIDFGDLTAGDPAYDLAISLLAFDEPGQAAFRRATGTRYDEATWIRARGWAAADTLMFLLHTDDDPEYAAFGREALASLTA